MSAGERAAGAASAAVGARFRLHGRERETGLDCVGVAALAMRAGGYGGEVPTGYAMRGGDAAALETAGLARADGTQVGDLLLMRAGPGQLHLGVRVAGGIVHADAGLRCVVWRPGVPPWPVLGSWRVGEG